MKDFFISYNKADNELAKWIAGTLEEHGYTTVIQAWDFAPGNNFILKMQEEISNCERLILVLSHSYLKSEYCQAEWSAIFNCDPAGDKRRLIPIRVDDVNPEGLLSSVVYIDFVGVEKEDVAVKKLLCGVGNSKNPRKKPAFPLSRENDLSSSVFVQGDAVEFTFDLEIDNSIGNISVLTKNKLREWYFNSKNADFKVSINDKRQIRLRELLEKIDLKIQGQQDLTIEEECDYENGVRILRKCIREIC